MMEKTGRFAGISKDLRTGKTILQFELDGNPDASIDEISRYEKLTIIAKPYRQKRSLNANAYLWECLGQMAQAMIPPADKWDVYLLMLKRYGKYTYIVIKPNAVDRMRAMWRESEVIGEISINGVLAVQMLCYYGSSTYDSKEMSVLLDGVVSEMKNMGLVPPPTEDMRRVLKEMEEREHAQENESPAV